MSYLLDALKKAEAERASLESDELHQASVELPKASVLPGWVVWVVVSLLLVTFFQLFFDDQKEVVDGEYELAAEETGRSSLILPDTRPILSEALATQKIKEAEVKSEDESYQLKQGEVLIKPSTVSPNLIGTEREISSESELEGGFKAESNNSKDLDQPRQLAELTKGQLSRIPSLSLESHLYSSVAEYSSVVINGKTYAEGDYLSSKIIIKHIDANGIVISLGDLLVELPKGISWVSTNHVK